MAFGFRSTIKSLFDVKSWMGWDQLVQNGEWIGGMYRRLLKPAQTSNTKETFEEACKRYGYTPEFLEHQKGQFELAATVYLTLLIIGLVYMLWLILHHKMMASVIMGPLNFMLFSFYFRESFWLMQIRQKRLGMTFKDWLNIVVLRNGKAH